MKGEPNIDDWKIWPQYEVFYIESLLTLTGTAISDYERLDRIISNQELLNQNPYILIDLAENILNQAATISRYFWPAKLKPHIHILRGEKLREKLVINDDNILKSRPVRNFIEHFDNNFDVFVCKTIEGDFLPKISVFNSTELDEVTFFFSANVVNEFLYTILEREDGIIPVIKEIYRIHNLLIDFNTSDQSLR